MLSVKSASTFWAGTLPLDKIQFDVLGREKSGVEKLGRCPILQSFQGKEVGHSRVGYLTCEGQLSCFRSLPKVDKHQVVVVADVTSRGITSTLEWEMEVTSASGESIAWAVLHFSSQMGGERGNHFPGQCKDIRLELCLNSCPALLCIQVSLRQLRCHWAETKAGFCRGRGVGSSGHTRIFRLHRLPGATNTKPTSEMVLLAGDMVFSDSPVRLLVGGPFRLTCLFRPPIKPKAGRFWGG